MKTWIDNLKEGYTEITPNMAQAMLDTMGRNRNLNLRKVRQYARDMESGNFKHCVDPICFNTNGELINGQHRLNAIIMVGTSAGFYILKNVPNDTLFDIGQPRNSAQALYMAGRIPKKLANSEAVALVNSYLAAKIKGAARLITNADREKFMQRWGDEILTACELTGLGTQNGIMRKAGCNAAVFAALIDGISYQTLCNFCQIVNTGFATNNTQTAAIVLRNYLLTIGAGSGQIRLDEDSCTELAIWDFVRNKPRRKKYVLGERPYTDACPATVNLKGGAVR